MKNDDSGIFERANPADLRKAMDVATNFMKAGILFVPVPVFTLTEYEKMTQHTMDMLEITATKMESTDE